jgi:hypothetical protein
MKYKVIDNFLDEHFYKKIKETITHLDFPWRRRLGSTGPNTPTDKGYFTHSLFYKHFIINHDLYYNFINPILLKLEAKAIIQARFNMFVNEFFFEKTGNYHVDNTFLCNTGILNFTDSDGGTQLKINNEEITVQSKENQLLLFDSDILHRSVVPKNTDIRYILNINYF